MTGLAVLVLVCTIAVSGWAEDAKPAKKYGPNVGDYLKEFALKDAIDGRGYKLDSLLAAGRDTALIFMQTACSLCLAEIAEFRNSKEETDPKLSVFLVSVDLDSSRIKTYKEANNIPYVILHDKDASVLDSIEYAATPALVVLDSKGIIKEKKAGFNQPDVKTLLKKYK